MDSNLLSMIINVSDILRSKYGLSVEEIVKCMSQCEELGSNHMNDYESLAIFLYRKYEDNNRIKRSQELFNEIMKRRETIKELLSSDEYVNWLNEFTNEIDGFSDCDWNYFPTEISPENLAKVKLLILFFDGISDYADDNGIDIETHSWDAFYNLKYNDFKFRVGVCVGQGGFSFCDRINDDRCEFIDFNDVMNSTQNKEMKKVLG